MTINQHIAEYTGQGRFVGPKRCANTLKIAASLLRQYLLPRRSYREMQRHQSLRYRSCAAHGNDLRRRHRVQAFSDTGGRIAFRQRISRPVVKDIA